MMKDSELIKKAKNGDQEAIAALYERSYSKVYYTVRSMIKNEDDAFDILQDSYIKAFSHLDGFEGDEGAFTSWIRQIAANTACDWLKKKKPLLFSELSAGEDEDIPAEDFFEDERTENLPEQYMEQEETTRLIREILDELPEDQRAAIGMFYYEEMSVKEIAAAMNVSESAVKSRLLYGRRKVEKKVRELEKKGTKLYDLSPILFLLWLFRSRDSSAEKPDPVLFRRIIGDVSGDGLAAAGNLSANAAETLSTLSSEAGRKTAGTAAAGVSAAAAGAGLSAGKAVLIVIAAAAVIGGGIFGIAKLSGQGNTPVTTLVPSAETAADTESTEGRTVPAPVTSAETAETTAEQGTTSEPESTAEEETTVEEETAAKEETTADPQEEALARWKAAEEAAGRIVLEGSVNTYSYDEVIRLQGMPDPNAANANKKNTYRIIILDEPQVLSGTQVGESVTREVKMICIKSPYSKEPTLPANLDGQHIVFSVSSASISWPGGTDLPLGMPRTSDLHYME